MSSNPVNDAEIAELRRLAQAVRGFGDKHPVLRGLAGFVPGVNDVAAAADVAGAPSLKEAAISATGFIPGGKSAEGMLARVLRSRAPTIVGHTAEIAPELEQRFADLVKQPGMKAKYEELLANNGSEPGAVGAGSQEAVNRVAQENAAGQTRHLINPEGTATPLSGVDSVDAKAPPGHIIYQKGVGILDRGGLPQSHAEGLLSRALSLNGGDLPELSDIPDE